MRIGGRGRWAGRGTITASRRLNPSTCRLTRSSVQRRVRMSRLRSNRRPRCLNGTPTASNSRAYQPAATPRRSRPPEITSRVPSALAAIVGLRSGRTMTPVPSLTRRVRAAIAVRMPTASRMGKAGSTPRITWSQAQSDSKPSASARSAYARIRSTSGVSAGPTKFLIASPQCMCPLVRASAEKAPFRVEGAEHLELPVRRRLGRLEALGLGELEARVGPDRVHRHAGMRRLDAHALRGAVATKDSEGRDDARDAAEVEPGGGARTVALEPAGAGDEIDAGDEPTLLVRRHDDHLAAERGEVVGAASPRQPYLGLPVVRADRARVDVAVLVDLRAAHESDIDETALREQERVGDPRQHGRAAPGAHLVGRDRQSPRRAPGPH